MDPHAINAKDSLKAKGLGQFTDATWRQMNKERVKAGLSPLTDIFDPEQATEATAFWHKVLLEKHAEQAAAAFRKEREGRGKMMPDRHARSLKMRKRNAAIALHNVGIRRPYRFYPTRYVNEVLYRKKELEEAISKVRGGHRATRAH